MSIKETLKSSDILRRLVKRGKNYYEFLSDAKDFSNNYAEIVEQNGDYRYRLMLLIHNIEKGMCRENPRPFGKDRVKRIIDILKEGRTEKRDLFEYRLARAVLISWRQFYEDKDWEIDKDIRKYIENIEETDLTAGRELLHAPIKEISSGLFKDVLFSRRSVRDFEQKPLRKEDIEFALNCFIKAPTACNRQMCKVYKIEDYKKKELMNSTILGVGGFNTNAMTLFIITYDIGAFEFYGERNQSYVNVGLTAMNFANGLHARGIGSCFMQWSNKRSDDLKIRKTLGIPDRERIGLVMGAGYYKDEVFIPCSTRKRREDYYTVL